MEPSFNCLEFIKKEEGCVLHAYQDQAGIWTIGIGSTMHKNGQRIKKGEVISMEDAMELLRWEVRNKSVGVVNAIRNRPLTQNQFDALVSFAYNVGVGGFQSSTLLKKLLVNPNDPTIAAEFAKWNKITVGGKKVANAGLTARRRRESALYFKP